MNGRSKYLIKNVGILTVSNFASKLLIFLLVPLYTSVLSADEVGLYDIIVSSLQLALPILTFNIVDALMRFLMEKDQPREVVASIGMKYVAGSLIPMFLFLVVSSRMELLHAIHGYEFYIFFYYLFNCLYQYGIQFAKGIEMVSVMGVAGVLGTITTLTSNIFFLVVVKAGLPGFFLASILGQAIPSFYLLYKTKLWRFISGVKNNRLLQKEMLTYCTPLIATAIGWWVNSASDKYVVLFICGMAANGLLSVSYKVPAIINTLQQIFVQAWQISAIKEYGDQDTDIFYGRIFRMINILMVLAGSILILFAKPMAYVLYQKEFFSAWKYVPYLVVSSVINAASGILGPILSAKKASKPMALSAVYGAGTNVVLNIILVYLVGIQGATIATVISSFIIFAVRKKAANNEIKIEGYSVILISWMILGIQATLEIYTRLWWTEVILVIAVVLLNRKEIGELYRRCAKHLRKPRL